MDPFQNPFSPGAGTEPPAFLGRDSLLKSYEVALHRTINGRPGKSIMPIGLRGVGKTVLLNHFHQLAQEHQLAAALIEAPETGEFKQLLAARLRAILLEFDRGTVSSKVKQALGTSRRSRTRFPMARPSLSIPMRLLVPPTLASWPRTSQLCSWPWEKLPRTEGAVYCLPSTRFSIWWPRSWVLSSVQSIALFSLVFR